MQIVYRSVSALVLAGVVALCIGASHLGEQRTGDMTAYFYEAFDVGHPGVVNAVTSMALIAVALISLILGLLTWDVPWFVNACLFVVLAADNLLRLHNHVPTGDVTARLVYWTLLLWLVMRLRPFRSGVLGGPLVAFGLMALAAGELLDASARDQRGTAAVIEESLACIGSWALAMASVGVAVSTLARSAPAPRTD
ncbi:MAG: hypothetical protein H6836_10325 [Planctomycetes bacterium]|nr:hypothetical protein [Planctomycetota bacterium]